VNFIVTHLGTKLLKKVALAIVEVIVARTDNTWDDDILSKLKSYEG